MRRFFACLMIAVLLLSLFPIVVSATGRTYKIENINDMLLIRYKDGLQAYDGEWYLFGTPVSVHQVFMYRILLLSGHEFGYVHDTVFRLDRWEKEASALSDFVAWDTVSVLMNSFIFINDDFVQVAFSSEFVSSVDSWLSIWNSQNDLNLELSLCSVTSFDSASFFTDPFSYVCFLKDDDTYFEIGGYSPSDFFLQLYSEYISTDVLTLTEFWQLLRDSININLLTSWLPDALASPIRIYWLFFVSLLTVLVFIKIKN